MQNNRDNSPDLYRIQNVVSEIALHCYIQRLYLWHVGRDNFDMTCISVCLKVKSLGQNALKASANKNAILVFAF